ncbi:hypothetical protein PVAP13_9NG296846 [Panicum virgatum]|uniref:Uncharacterized protein n=1 Tax=Panicum virgatum TaxID=38727 RepID=A0A8T0MRQ7_PANVG|nr:hypothetical protein PVAP13_9NG296846 [Panicum virgatum]
MLSHLHRHRELPTMDVRLSAPALVKETWPSATRGARRRPLLPRLLPRPPPPSQRSAEGAGPVTDRRGLRAGVEDPSLTAGPSSGRTAPRAALAPAAAARSAGRAGLRASPQSSRPAELEHRRGRPRSGRRRLHGHVQAPAVPPVGLVLRRAGPCCAARRLRSPPRLPRPRRPQAPAPVAPSRSSALPSAGPGSGGRTRRRRMEHGGGREERRRGAAPRAAAEESAAVRSAARCACAIGGSRRGAAGVHRSGPVGRGRAAPPRRRSEGAEESAGRDGHGERAGEGGRHSRRVRGGRERGR